MNIPRVTFRNQQRGVISLLALIIMAAITSIAVGASIITITELRQSETIGQSFVAAYAAESGMENGLYAIKMNRSTSSVAATDAILNTEKDPHTGKYDEQPVSTGFSATWHRSAVPSLKRVQVARLLPDQSVALDYYNPDSFTHSLNDQCGTPNPPCGTRLYVTWEDNCNGLSWLEVTATDLSFLFESGTTRAAVAKVKGPCNCSEESCKSTDLTGHQVCTPMQVSTFFFLDENGDATLIDMRVGNPMRFTFRPMVPISATDVKCTIENLTAEIHDDYWGQHDNCGNGGDNPCFTDQQLEQVHFEHTKDLPAHITITSTGAFGNTRQALTATVPWKAPVSGLLNFVLFSDQDIMK